MKYTLILLLTIINLFSCLTMKSQIDWPTHYEQISKIDNFFHQDIFMNPGPQPILKTWWELNAYARLSAKRHMRTFHGPRIYSPNDITGTLHATGRAIKKIVIYVTTSAVAAVIVGTLINQPARHF